MAEVKNKKKFLFGVIAGLGISLLVVVVIAFFVSNSALAQVNVDPGFGATFGLGTADLESTVIKVIQWVLGFLGLVAVIMIIYGGFVWMTARGNQERIDKAKKILKRAIVGLIIILLAWAIVTFIIKTTTELASGPGPCTDGDTRGSCELCVGGVWQWQSAWDNCSLGPLEFTMRDVETAHGGADPSQDVYLCSKIKPVFNHDVDDASVQAEAAANTLQVIKTSDGSQVAGSWVTTKKTITFSHPALFDPFQIAPTPYQLQVPKSLLDTSGLTLTNCTAPFCNDAGTYFEWNFETGNTVDDIAPTIISAYPVLRTHADYPDRNVNRAPIIRVVFDESIDDSTVFDGAGHPIDGNFALQQLDGENGAVVIGGPMDTDNDGVIDNNLLQASPTGDGFDVYIEFPLINSLESFTWYRITVANIEDLCGNAMTAGVDWEFQTNDVAPGVMVYYPQGSLECPATTIGIVFNTSMFNQDISFAVSDGVNINIGPIDPDWLFPGPYQITDGFGNRLRVVDPDNANPSLGFMHFELIPVNPLPTNSNFNVTVTTDMIKDQDGSVLDQSWSFQTATPETCACQPVVTSLNPNQGKNGECLTINGICFTGTPANPATPDIEFDLSGVITPATVEGLDPNGSWITTTVPAVYSNGDRPNASVGITYVDPNYNPVPRSNAVEFFVNSDDTANGPCLFSVNPSPPTPAYPDVTNVALHGIRFEPSDVTQNIHFRLANDKIRTGPDIIGWTDTDASTLAPPIIDPADYGINQVSVENNFGESNPLPIQITPVPPDIPVVTSWTPTCSAVCVNANIYGTIANFDVTATIDTTTVKLYSCDDDTCSLAGGLTPVSISTASVFFNGDTVFQILVVPAGTLLNVNQSYRVVLTNGIQTPEGGVLGNLNFDETGDAINDSFSWTFKTKDDASLCLLDSVSINPVTTTQPVNMGVNYLAQARGSPDACDPGGQVLPPGDFTWTWSVIDPLSRVPVPANIAGFLENTAIVNTVANTGNDPVQIDAQADDIPNSITRNAQGELNITDCETDQHCRNNCPVPGNASRCDTETGKCTPWVGPIYLGPPGIDPVSGPPGTTVTVEGCYFGNREGELKFGVDPASFQCLDGWSDRQIIGTTKEDMAVGSYPTEVITANGNRSLANDSTLGLWHLDEGTGSTAGDSSGNGNIGELQNGVVWSSGRYNGGLDFDGVDDKVFVDNSAGNLDTPNNLTASFWFYPRAYENSGAGYVAMVLIDNVWGGPNTSFRFYWTDTDGVSFETWDGATIVKTFSGHLNLDQWYWVVGVYDSSVNIQYLYINGSLVGSLSRFNTLNGVSQDIYFGCSGACLPPLQSFDGIMDEIRIYDVAKGATEIADNYIRSLSNRSDSYQGTTYSDVDFTVTNLCDGVAVPPTGMPGLCNIVPSTGKEGEAPITFEGFNLSSNSFPNTKAEFSDGGGGFIDSPTGSGNISGTAYENATVPVGAMTGPARVAVQSGMVSYCRSNSINFGISCDNNADCSTGCCQYDGGVGVNICKPLASCSSGGVGDLCQIPDDLLTAPNDESNPNCDSGPTIPPGSPGDYECISDTGDTQSVPPDTDNPPPPPYGGDCRFCCTPGQISSTGLTCVAEQGGCISDAAYPDSRGLYCGCNYNDNVIGDAQCDPGGTGTIGCGRDTCCYERPAVWQAIPTGSDICRNSTTGVLFNAGYPLDPDSLRVGQPLSNDDAIGIWHMDEGGGTTSDDAVGDWHFEDGSGTTAVDSSGNGIDGTLVGGVSWTNGRYGNGLEFNQVQGDIVDLGNPPSLNITDTITVEAWVKPYAGGLDNYRTIISKGYPWSDTQHDLAYALRLSNDSGPLKAFFDIGVDDPELPGVYRLWIGTDNNISNGEWSHLVGTYDGAQACLYVNGVLDQCQGKTDPIPISSEPVYIGDLSTDFYPPNTEDFYGTIDEVRIYNRAKTAEEIADNYRTSSGRIVSDSSGNGNDGALVGGAAWANGRYDGGVEFDGIDDYVSVADDTSLDITDEITMEAWVYPYTYGQDGSVIPQPGDTRSSVILTKSQTIDYLGPYWFEFRNNGVLNGYFKNQAGATNNISSTIVVGKWQHIVSTYNASTETASLYINGVLAGSANWPGFGELMDGDDFWMGTGRTTVCDASIDYGCFFNGRIDEVRIYNRAKTTEEIEENYKTMVGNFELYDNATNDIIPINIQYDNGSTLVGLPVNYFEPGQTVRGVVKGRPLGGVLSAEGVDMTQSLIYDFDGDGINDSYSWTFDVGNEICQVDHLQFTSVIGDPWPPNWVIFDPKPNGDLFTCALDSCFEDWDASIAGNQHILGVDAQDINNVSLSGFTFTFSEGSDPLDVIDIQDYPPAPEVAKYITAHNKNGTASVRVDATSIDAGSITDSVLMRVLLCENPWPNPHAPDFDNLPFVDNDYNFSMWYCRGDEAASLLPELMRPGDFIIKDGAAVANDGQDDMLREYFFLYRNTGISDDAIGIRIYENEEGQSPSEWYRKQFGPAAPEPQNLTVDGYPAVRAGRTVYVAAWNYDGAVFWPNIYLISYNEGAAQDTIDIYNRLLNNWKFNTNILPDDKVKLMRDMQRLNDLNDIYGDLLLYKGREGTFPKLEGGTYVSSLSTSKWPSWQETLSAAAGNDLPVDPINDLALPDAGGLCDEVDGFDQSTCWNDTAKNFECPTDSHIYMYIANPNGDTANMYTQLEYLFYNGTNWVPGPGALFDPCGVGYADIPNATCGCFNYSFNFTGTAADFAGPVINDVFADGTPFPLAGSVNGTVLINVDADDGGGTGVDQVEFYIDGFLKFTDSDGADGWNWNIDTTEYADIFHVLKVIAYDVAGNWTEISHDLFIDNFGGADNTPPFVEILEPVDGATVAGASVTLSAIASDNQTIATFNFDILDSSSNIVFSVSPPCTTGVSTVTCSGTWDTTVDIDSNGIADFPNGQYTVKATVIDGNTNSFTDTNAITVDNFDIIDPVVDILPVDGLCYEGVCDISGEQCFQGILCANRRACLSNPDPCNEDNPCVNGSSCQIRGFPAVRVTATDNNEVTRVLYYVDDIYRGDGTDMGGNIWEWVWDTSSDDSGFHQLDVFAYDASGNYGVDTYTFDINQGVYDTTPPFIQWLPPTPNNLDTVEDEVVLHVEALDDGTCSGGDDDGKTCYSDADCAAPGVCQGVIGVSKVNFYVDYQRQFTDTTYPYAWGGSTCNGGPNDGEFCMDDSYCAPNACNPLDAGLDTNLLSEGWHTIQADAVDSTGNRSGSVEILINIHRSCTVACEESVDCAANEVCIIATDPCDNSCEVFSCNFIAGVSGDPADIWMSEDEGATWTNRTNGTLVHSVTGVNMSHVQAMAEIGNGIIYAGTATEGESTNGARMYKSEDWGLTWSELSPVIDSGAGNGNDHEPGWITSLEVANDGTIYAGAFGYNNGAVFSSTDDGTSWNIAGDLSGASATSGLLIASDGAIYAGTNSTTGNIFKSNDNGVSWATDGNPNDANGIPAIIQASNGYLYAAGLAGNKMYRSTDNGGSWINTHNLGTGGVRSLLQADNGYLFAGTGSGSPGEGDIYRSVDDGGNWTLVFNDVNAERVLSLIDIGGTVYAGVQYDNMGTTEARIYRSIDSGDTWVYISQIPGTSVRTLELSCDY